MIEETKFSIDEHIGPPKHPFSDPSKQFQFKEGVNLSSKQESYLLRHFTMVLVGKPGSGKTSAIRTLLTDSDYYRNMFDQILLMSPSANKMGVKVKKENVSQEFNLKWIEQRLFEMNKKQVQAIAARLKELNIIDKFDVEKLNGHLMDSIRTDMSRKDAPSTGVQHSQQMPNLFADKERFFSTALRKSIMNSGGVTNLVTQGAGGVGSRKKKAIAPGEPASIDLASYVDQMYQLYYTKLPQEERQFFYKNCLIIFDDMVSQIKANEFNPLLTQLIFNRRHLFLGGCISVMIVAQKYTMIPARIRSNANWMLLFRLNVVDFETVFKDVVMLNHEQWQSLLDFVYGGVEKKYNNLGIWVESDEYFMNFQKIKFDNNNSSSL